ncbi:MAG: hypothetical protein ACOVOR_00665 [Rhabdochlamydiaceae bacterium]
MKKGVKGGVVLATLLGAYYFLNHTKKGSSLKEHYPDYKSKVSSFLKNQNDHLHEIKGMFLKKEETSIGGKFKNFCNFVKEKMKK